MSDDLDARIAQLQGLIGQDESAQQPQQGGGGFGQPAPSPWGQANQGTQAGGGGQAQNNAFGGNNNSGGAAGNQGGNDNKAPPRFAKDADERSIFVGGLPKADETPEEVGMMFVHCGQINKVTLLRDKQTQALKGQAYIEFATHEAAGKALDSMQQALFRGQGAPLVVTKKRSKFDEARGRGGGGIRGRGRGAGDPMQMMMQAFASMARGAFRGGRGGFRGGGRGRGGRGGGRGFGGDGGQPFGGNNNMNNAE